MAALGCCLYVIYWQTTFDENLKMRRGHWVTNTSTTIWECFSHFNEMRPLPWCKRNNAHTCYVWLHNVRKSTYQARYWILLVLTKMTIIIGNSLFHQKQSASNRLLVVSRTDYAQVHLLEQRFSEVLDSCRLYHAHRLSLASESSTVHATWQ